VCAINNKTPLEPTCSLAARDDKDDDDDDLLRAAGAWFECTDTWQVRCHANE